MLNKNLRDNLLPLWISNELSISEAIDILNTVDGKIETAKILHEANKIVTLFNKPVINRYGFPIISEHAISLRELECQNFEIQSKHIHINSLAAGLPNCLRRVTLLSKNNLFLQCPTEP